MNSKEGVLDQRLNAFADGELDAVESEQVLSELEQDARLQTALCDIHRIKDMVRYAYPESPPHGVDGGDQPRRRTLLALTASVIFAIGVVGGHQLEGYLGQSSVVTLSQLPEPLSGKVVLYVNESNSEKFERALRQAELLLRNDLGQQSEVNLVVSAGGLDLLRRDHSSFNRRIAELAKAHQTLGFIACSKTLAMRRAEGQSVNLVDQAEVADSAVEFIVRRLQQGWSYVAI